MDAVNDMRVAGVTDDIVWLEWRKKICGNP